MDNWKDILILPSVSIHDALEVIDKSSIQFALVVDENRRLLGTLTDGDIRRGILKGISLDSPVQQVMNLHPTVASQEDGVKSILAMMKSKSLRHIPVVDSEDRVINVELLDDLTYVSQRKNWVVIMAGGLGTRLRPLTDNCPKPLLKVGTKPILEIILENFMEYGFCRFYLAVNYKAEMVKAHFGNGSRWGAEIRYINEKRQMGTAGALGLLKDIPQHTFIVMNGDLLTKINFQNLLEFHNIHQARGTICVREYDYQIPYGVVKFEQGNLSGIDEKPVQRCFINAGIYVLEPDTLEAIPKGIPFNMPDLFQKLVKEKQKVTAFPIREYWLDIGQMPDFERANGEFTEVFK